MKTKRLPFFSLFCFCQILLLHVNLQAQNIDSQTLENNKNLHLIGKYSDGGITLRWAPTSAGLWEEANEVGYIVERLALPENVDGLKNRRFERITDLPLKPAPPSVWEQPTQTDDAAAAAYMMLYGERPELPSTDLLSKIKQQGELADNAFFISLSAAELSAQAADLLALRLVDKNVQKGKRYLYRVYAAAPLAIEPMDTALVFVEAMLEAQPVPIGMETLPGEKKVQVKWNIDLNQGQFFAYHIERSDIPNGPFKRLNGQPLLHLKNKELPQGEPNVRFFTDSVGVNYRPFYYRLIGITPFAEESAPSEVVMGMGKDLTPPTAPAIREAEREGESEVFLRWEKTLREHDLAGFIVGRSSQSDGGFQPIHEGFLPISTTTFLDRNPDLVGQNYYTVTAVDTAGNEASSLSAYVFFPDTTPPAPPIGLTGTVDTSGLVRLTWTPNEEGDLMGYRVYWANDAAHKFIMVSEEMVKEASYQHAITIKTLSEKVYYRVAAVDNGFGHSDFSEILELERPDVVPPSPGLIEDFRVTDRGVELTWAPSGSEDLASQQLLRQQKNGEWEVVKTFGPKATSYLDEGVTNGGDYQYALRTTDDDGLQSSLSFPLGVSISTLREMPPVENLEVVFNEEKQGLELRWQYASATGRRFVIYRSVNGTGLRSYESVSGSTDFSDLRLPEKGGYAYAVRVVDDETGRESGLQRSGVVRVD